MTPVYKLSASSITGRTNYGSMLAGNPAVTFPGDFESIATVSVGSGGSSTITFSSIPATYTHLQIRGIAKFSGGDGLGVRVGNGSIDTGSNYATHTIQGNGSSASAGAGASENRMNLGYDFQEFGPFILDILDYANTNKYKTCRALSGNDNNGSGYVQFRSGLWQSTSAITEIRLYGALSSVSFSQYSHFALYGIKGAA